MTIGAGIAIAAIWIVASFVITHRTVTGIGMTMMLIAASIATVYVCGVKP